MIPFYLAAACCLPASNPEARIREKELFRAAAKERAQMKRRATNERLRGDRWSVVDDSALAVTTGRNA